MTSPTGSTPCVGDDICNSPTLSSTSGISIVSFDTIFSNPDMIYPDALGGGPLPQHATISGGSETPAGIQLATDDSFVRHDKYFFKDGNITFLVDGTLFCVHRYFFSRDSVHFSTKFALLGVRDHEAFPTVVSLSDVVRNDFEAFLSVLYPEDFEGRNLSYEQWKSVLCLSTRWEFASLRKLALSSIEPPTPFDRLLLARAYAVDSWVLPALSALCTRATPVTLREARQLSIEDVVLVATVRENIRNDTPPVDAAEISRRIEVVRAEMLYSAAGDDSLPTRECGASKREPSTAVAVTFSMSMEEGICKEAVSSAKVDEGHGSDEHLDGSEVSTNEVCLGKWKSRRKAKKKIRAFKEELAAERCDPEFESISGEPGMQKPIEKQSAAVEDIEAVGSSASVTPTIERTERTERPPLTLDTVLRAWTAASSAGAPPRTPSPVLQAWTAASSATLPPRTSSPVLRAWTAACSATAPPRAPSPSEKSTANLWADSLDSFLGYASTRSKGR